MHLVLMRGESFHNYLSGAAGESDAVSEQDKRKQNLADTAITSDKQQQIIIHAVLNSALKAVRLDSVNLVGYLQWSFVDGFEFVTQHTQGWGLVGLDWTNPKRKRYIKPFGYWFSDLVESRGFENRDFICESPLPERREIKPVQFKKDFIWATATAATQVGFHIEIQSLWYFEIRSRLKVLGMKKEREFQFGIRFRGLKAMCSMVTLLTLHVTHIISLSEIYK